jgi:hypothetical protein
VLIQPGTSKPGFYKYVHEGKNVWLLDTPGFDDTYRSDTDILKDIALCLSDIHSKGIALAGIIYLHRITDVRITGSAFINLQMLEKLAGEDALSRVVVATTMWNRLDRSESGHSLEVGDKRQKELKDTFLGRFQRKGSLMTKHEGDARSAQAIVWHLIKDDAKVVLDIQREMVDDGLDLSQTAAGKFLQSEHLKMREKYERDLADAQEAMEVAQREKDQELISELSQHQEDCKSAIARAEANKSSLEINFKSLLQEKDKQYATLVADVEAERKAWANEMKIVQSRLAEVEEDLRRQGKKYGEEIKRIGRDQTAKSVAEKEKYERRYAEIKNQIAALGEKRPEAASSMTQIGSVFGAWNAIFNNGRLERQNSYQLLPRNYHQSAPARDKYRNH